MSQLQRKMRDTDNSPSPAVTTNVSAGDVSSGAEAVSGFLTELLGKGFSWPPGESRDFYSEMVSGILKVESIKRGKITCFFSVIPAVLNIFNGLHGGMVAVVVERVATACARTVVAEDKELFLAELSMSYLSAASHNAELVVESLLAKTGRNATMVTVEIRSRQGWKLMYLSHATFLHKLPNSKL